LTDLLLCSKPLCGFLFSRLAFALDFYAVVEELPFQRIEVSWVGLGPLLRDSEA